MIEKIKQVLANYWQIGLLTSIVSTPLSNISKLADSTARAVVKNKYKKQDVLAMLALTVVTILYEIAVTYLVGLIQDDLKTPEDEEQ